MSRVCDDCGIPRWQDCICTDEGAARVDEQGRRICVQHAIAAAADELLLGVDPACQPLTDAHRIARLTEYLGDVASDVRVNDCLDLDAMLVQLGAGVQVWLEQRAREAAR